MKPCGTATAYKRHLSHGERPCEPCTEAVREYNNALRQKRRLEDTTLDLSPDFNADHARSALTYFLNYLKTRDKVPA